MKALYGAEGTAFGWYAYFKAQSNQSDIQQKLSLAADVAGTGHGISKVPYLRESRRSVGIDNFRLMYDDLYRAYVFVCPWPLYQAHMAPFLSHPLSA